MVDGNGILHPYSFGIACQIGVTTGYPCIGVAKSLLCGSVKNNDVIYEGEKKGNVFYAHNRVKNPIYVSPGNKISFVVFYQNTYIRPDAYTTFLLVMYK